MAPIFRSGAVGEVRSEDPWGVHAKIGQKHFLERSYLNSNSIATMKENSASDWREEMMSHIRDLIKEADPEIVEEKKYKTPSNPEGVFVWYKEGMISTGETYKKHLRLAFTKGPELKEYDPKGLINSYRAIILHEEDKFDDEAFKDLIKAAVKLNSDKKSKGK